MKDRALMSLSGKWTVFVAFTLLVSVASSLGAGAAPLMIKPDDVSTGMALIPMPNYFGFMGVSLLTFFLFMPLSWGYQISTLQTSRTGLEPEISTLISGYKDYWRITGTYLLMLVYVTLWSLLLVIPGIIKTFSYAMTGYVLRDNPELSFNGAIERSMALMQGHKMELFVLYLSFIGWFILAMLTCGIGFLWLYPYVQMSITKFYESLLEDERAAANPNVGTTSW